MFAILDCFWGGFVFAVIRYLELRLWLFSGLMLAYLFGELLVI